MEELQGVTEGTLFRNADNGYSVISIRSGGSLVTVTGNLPELGEGEEIELEGEWTHHPVYGRQFKASNLRINSPRNLQAIEKYLGSGLIKGVGPSTARLIVQTFGKDTLEILSANPERLEEVPKIGRKRMEQIAKGFMEQQASRATYLFLQRYDIPSSLSAKIYKLYRDQAEVLIRDNPYRLVDEVDGVGFRTADRIAMRLGIAQGDSFRINSGIKFALLDAAASGGHTCLPREVLVHRAAQLLDVEPEEVGRHLTACLLNKELFEDQVMDVPLVSLPRYRKAEMEVARRLLTLAGGGQQLFAQHVAAKIAAYEKSHHIRFSDTQRDAITTAVQTGMTAITGGPGTGKTTLINCIIHVLGEDSGILLAAPTGRAAKRLSEATGQEASTVHRLLKYGGEDGAFQINQDSPLDCTCIIVDEVSMMDIFLMRSLLEAIQPGTRLILVGDADQLPSVGPGNVLWDILASPGIAKVRLREIFRQGDDSMIVLNAHRINQGQLPELNAKKSDFFFENRPVYQVPDCIVQLVQQRLPAYLQVDAREIQVLSPTRKGPSGVNELNRALQQAVNPKRPSLCELQFGEVTFRDGDKVMHIKNNYQLAWTMPDGTKGQGVFNGDIGFVERINQEDLLVDVLYDDGRLVQYEFTQLEELELAYCLSIHKSQGSEFAAVILPMTPGPPMLLTRNLLYTGVTRAKRLVVLVGSQQIMGRMVDNNQERRRYSALLHWLTFYTQVSQA